VPLPLQPGHAASHANSIHFKSKCGAYEMGLYTRKYCEKNAEADSHCQLAAFRLLWQGMSKEGGSVNIRPSHGSLRMQAQQMALAFLCMQPERLSPVGIDQVFVKHSLPRLPAAGRKGRQEG